MRLALLTTVVAIGALACGKKGDQNQSSSAAPPAAAPAGSESAPTGNVVEVKMTGNGSTRAAYEPNSITITPGTTVRFVNVSGGPHNITFWQDSIPAGAATALNANMKNTVDNLSGPFLTNANETYDVSFANAPKGRYKGYCTPHLTLGMKMTIKVE